MELNKFQYTAPSKSSASFFPTNKANKFQVKLPNPITLPGEWEGCLVDIQYHTAWLTFEKPQYFILWMLPEDWKKFNLLNYEAAYSDQYYIIGRKSAVAAQEVKWSTETYRPFNSQHRLQTIIALPVGNYGSISDCVSSGSIHRIKCCGCSKVSHAV